MSANRVIPAALVAAALLAVPAAGAGGFPSFGPGCARADFASAGTTVRAELCRASSSGRAVVVLHGCGGFSTFDHRLALELPRLGISTLDVDYFGPTPAPGKKGFCGEHGGRGADPFPVWTQVAEDAARALRATAGIDRHGVGVVGWSMGGGVAIAAAQTGRRPWDAVAAFSARGDASGAARMPPTILLSGGARDAIPLSETRPFYLALRRARIASSLYVYPHGSHNWPGAQGTLGIQHAVAFLRHYLR